MSYFELLRITQNDFLHQWPRVHIQIKRRIEINKIDTRIRELAPIAQPRKVIAEVEPVH